MVTGVLELLAVEPQPHQPDTEGEQLVLALGFAHDGAALGDGLSGDGEAQVHIGGYFSGVEGSVETPPFHGAAVKDRMQIQGMVACPVIMLGVFHDSFVPHPFQLGEVGGLVRGQRPGLPQHGFPYLFAPALRSGFAHLQSLK